MNVKIKDLYEKKGVLATEMVVLKKVAEDAKRDFTKEEKEKFFKIDEDFEHLEKEIKILEKIEAVEADQRKIDEAKPIIKEDNKEISQDEIREVQDSAFNKHILGMIPKDRRVLKEAAYTLSEREQKVLAEVRAQSVGTTTAGGHTTMPGFSGEFDKALLEFGGMFEASRIRRTDTGTSFDWPTVDDTTNEGALLAENTAAGELDTVWGNVTFDAYKYTSGLIRISNELIQDSEFNIPEEIASLLVERLGRAWNRSATTGTGSSQPNGVVTAAASGGTAALSTAIAYGDFTELKHNVDPAYRRNGGRWMFSDGTLKAIKEMTVGSSDNRPLWIPGIAAGEPSTVDGDPYSINQHMADYAASASFLLYGDFSKYVMRIVRDIQIARSTDRYMEVDQLALVGFARFDSDILNANAVKVMRAPAT